MCIQKRDVRAAGTRCRPGATGDKTLAFVVPHKTHRPFGVGRLVQECRAVILGCVVDDDDFEGGGRRVANDVVYGALEIAALISGCDQNSVRRVSGLHAGGSERPSIYRSRGNRRKSAYPILIS